MQGLKSKVHIGTSCLTKDLVWCDCGRGLTLTGKWLFCPECGAEIDQASYLEAIKEAKLNGAELYRNMDADKAMVALENVRELLKRMPHRKDCPAARLEVDDHRCTCGLHAAITVVEEAA